MTKWRILEIILSDFYTIFKEIKRLKIWHKS